MEITNGKICEWFVTPEYLPKALRQIDDHHGSKLLCVVEDKTGTLKNGFVVYYKNPPAAKVGKTCGHRNSEYRGGGVHFCSDCGQAIPSEDLDE